MPPLAIAGGLAAAGAVGGAVISANAAKKASKAAQQTAQDNIAATRENRDYQYKLNAPTIDMGGRADSTIEGLLNIGGDPAKSAAALQAFRDSSGYQGILDEGLKAVNSNAYARGMGDSGAAMKALQDRGGQIADRSLTGYLGQLTDVANRGGQARGLVAGVGTNSTNSIIQAQQYAGDAKGNAALAQGAALSNGLQGLLGAGAFGLGSSYGGGGGSFTPGFAGASSQPFNLGAIDTTPLIQNIRY